MLRRARADAFAIALAAVHLTLRVFGLVPVAGFCPPALTTVFLCSLLVVVTRRRLAFVGILKEEKDYRRE
jgi:hypothetical protein